MGYSSPTTRNPRVRVADGVAARERVIRSPSIPFNLKTKPYQIQPIGIMPVFPAEGLKNIMLQAQVWSDPLATGMKNIGWWCEYYYFYVKWSDLRGYDNPGDIGSDLALMMTEDQDVDPHADADGEDWTYCYPGGVDFVKECTARVVDEYFRDEGETWSDADKLLDDVPIAKIYGNRGGDAFQRLTLAADYVDRRTALPSTMDEMSLAEREWMAMSDMGMLDMDFKDWMKAYGSSVNTGGVILNEMPVQSHKPELIGYRREVSYPTNTVEPSTGNPATAAGWRVKTRFDEYKFFKYPGWVIGFNVVRPKVYLGNQQGTVSGLMQTRATWLPPQMMDHHTVSHVLVDDLAGPLAATMTTDYWMDLRDYLNHGEQFINYATPATGATARSRLR